jgi:uncharacterized protein YpiB (UPF0302 family)
VSWQQNHFTVKFTGQAKKVKQTIRTIHDSNLSLASQIYVFIKFWSNVFFNFFL